MRRVIVESPYAGDVERNVRYARACVADCLARGEAPLASHLLYTEWRAMAEATVIYVDLGWSTGMTAGLEHALRYDDPDHVIEIRRLGGAWARDEQEVTRRA